MKQVARQRPKEETPNEAHVVGHEDDDAHDDDVLEVVVGAGQVTQGFDEGLLSMRAGETAEFWLDPAFAFRENGCRGATTTRETDQKRGNIEPDACVRLRLTLCSYDNPMDALQTLEKIDQLKEKGNLAFREQKWDVALRQYHAALRHASTGQVWSSSSSSSASSSSSGSLLQRRSDVASVLCSNIAAVWFAKGDLSVTLQFVQRALRWNPDNAKALFRSVLVNERRLEFAEAMKVLETMRLKKLGDAPALDEVEARMRQKDASQSGAQKLMFQKMF